MSLIHWWPLTDNLNDIVGGKPFSCGSATYDAGKLGNGIKLTSTDLNVANPFIGLNDWSLTFWMCDNGGAAWSDFVCFSDNLNRLEIHSTSNNWYWYSSSTTSGIFLPSGTPIKTDRVVGIWHHIAMVKSSTNAHLYIDGTLVKSGTTATNFTSASAKLHFNSRANTSYGKTSYNDIRAYNHALSKAEIKELARAKVLHYTFDDDLACGTTNGAPVSGWSTYDSYWTLLERTEHGLKIQRASSTASPTVAIQNSSLKAKMANGDIWTFSCYLYKNGQPYKSSCTEISSPTSYYYKTQSWESREDGYYRNTFKIINTPGTWMLHNNFFGADPETGVQYEMRYIQFEKRDFATPYATTPRDRSLANEAGYYCSNSANDVEFTEVSRIGQRAIYCKDGLQRISATVPYLASDVLSTSIWFKTKGSPSANNLTAPKNGYHILLAVDSGRVEISIPTAGQLRFGGYNKTASNRFCSNFTATILDGNWHLINTVYDGLNWYGYVDGELKGTISVTSTKGDSPIVYSDKKLTIGRYYDDATRDYGATDAYIDDVRIYNSVLTESDIKDLYATGAKITKSGDILTANITERKTIGVTKKQNVEVAEFREDFVVGSGYERLDYIEFSEKEYIDTGLAFSDANIPIIIEADIVKTAISGNDCLAGCGIGSSWKGPVMLNFHNYTLEFGVNGYSTASDGSGSIALNERMSIRAEIYTNGNDHRWYKNGNRINLGSNAYGDRTSSNSTLYIGAFHNETGNSIASGSCWIGRLYSFKVWYGGSYRFLVPARRTSDGVLGLYDMAGTGFYTNIGGGALLAGQNINKTETKIYKNNNILGRQVIEI